MSSIIKSRNFVIKENEPLVLGTHFNLVDDNGNKIDEEGTLASANVPGLSKEESKKISLLAEIVALESDLEKSKKLYQGVTNEIQKAKDDAVIEIEKIKEDAYNEAYENGYNEGLTKGSAELHAEVDELKVIMEKAFKDDKIRFEAETEEKANDFFKEAKSVMKSIILTSVNQILKDDLKDEDLVETLILRGMLELKDEKKVTIYLSEEDFESFNKDEILKNYEANYKINFVCNRNFEKNECNIETEVGYIDCSLNNCIRNIERVLNENIN